MRTLLALLLLVSAAHPGEAGTKNGRSALPVLEVPTSARAAVLGAGFAAVADDLYSMQFNPAGLSFLTRQEATVLYLKGVEDTGLQFFGYGQPLKFPGILNFGYSTLAGGLLYSQNGTIEVNRTNPDGSLLDSRSLKAGSDMVASLGYSERIGEERLAGGRSLEFFGGLSLMYIRSTLAQKYTADAPAANAGLLMKLSEPRISFGASVTNFGPPVTYLSEPDPLPLTYRGALAYTLQTVFDHAFTISGGVEYAAVPSLLKPSVGLEWTVHRAFAIRTGYLFESSDQGGLSLGFGFAEKNFEMNYGWVPFDALTDQHRITLTWRFGPGGKQVRVQRRVKDIDRTPAEPRKSPEKRRTNQPTLLIPGWE